MQVRVSRKIHTAFAFDACETKTGTTAANLPPRLTEAELALVVKDLNKKDKFEEADASPAHAQVTHPLLSLPRVSTDCSRRFSGSGRC